MTDLKGLKAVVTGGASGIGLATARLLAERGADVAVLDLRPESLPGPLRGHRADVADDASVRAAVEAAAEDLGGIDVLVNNAGIGAVGTVEDNGDDEWRRLWEVNVLGIVRVSRAALPHLRRAAQTLRTARRSSTPAPSPPPPGCRSAPPTRPARVPCCR
ncbi:SDR family NAD(P)-dependent oxidoreductase [Actinomadura yumaensis]|uniref:SDR family NAD(P)-dependent oxidoreductase n=1 Tax=Actinomadura yumaensis TaxID=111807 RepID=UPI0036171CB0